MDMNLDFSKFDAGSRGISHMAFMFKIIDEKKRIVGNPKKDNMIVFARVKKEMVEEVTEDMCLGMASLLLDEGYTDSFDRCYKAIMCCHGDVDGARELLRSVMVTENQYQ